MNYSITLIHCETDLGSFTGVLYLEGNRGILPPRLRVTYSGRNVVGGFSRTVSEECPRHVWDAVAGFILTGALAPMLDYLTERDDVHPRLKDAVAEATRHYLEAR